jgi:DNA-directed RNA polymerase subunit M/transcription elongation factor TFIIS
MVYYGKDTGHGEDFCHYCVRAVYIKKDIKGKNKCSNCGSENITSNIIKSGQNLNLTRPV